MTKRSRLETGSSRTFLFAAVVCMLTALISFSQENLGRGRITGDVRDDGGAPVEGAKILAESVGSSTKLEGVSDKRGHFAIAGFGTGTWKITASKDGYAPSWTEMNVSQVKANPPVAFTLKRITGAAALKDDPRMLAVFDKGNALAGEGRYDEAIRVFEEFLAAYPAFYQARLNIASCYVKKNDPDRAEAEFKLVLDKVLMTHGDYKRDKAASIRALSGLGELYLKRNDFSSAQKAFAEALQISPEDETAAYNVGEIFFSNQKTDEAARYFELAARIKKEWPKPYYRLGFVYLNKGDYAKSLDNFNTFIRLDPENPEVPQVKNIVATIEKMKK